MVALMSPSPVRHHSVPRTAAASAVLVTRLTAALESLEYLGAWATLDGAESQSLTHAIAQVREVRKALDAPSR